MASVKKAPRGRKPASAESKESKAAESRRDKFLRLGKQRMEKTLKAISLIGNLSGSGYEYTEADVTRMNDALADAVEQVISRFNPQEKKAKGASFSFEGEAKAS